MPTKSASWRNGQAEDPGFSVSEVEDRLQHSPFCSGLPFLTEPGILGRVFLSIDKGNKMLLQTVTTSLE